MLSICETPFLFFDIFSRVYIFVIIFLFYFIIILIFYELKLNNYFLVLHFFLYIIILGGGLIFKDTNLSVLALRYCAINICSVFLILCLLIITIFNSFFRCFWEQCKIFAFLNSFCVGILSRDLIIYFWIGSAPSLLAWFIFQSLIYVFHYFLFACPAYGYRSRSLSSLAYLIWCVNLISIMIFVSDLKSFLLCCDRLFWVCPS